MKHLFTRIILSVSLFAASPVFADNLWRQADASLAPAKLQLMHPKQFLVFNVNEEALRLQMWNLSPDPREGAVITLPLPDGSFRDFKVWQSSLMPDDLAAKYPDIKSFTGEAMDDHSVTAKLDLTPFGFDAMIYDGENTSFVDPYDNYHDGYYMVHYKRDEVKDFATRMKCEVKNDNTPLNGSDRPDLLQSGNTRQAAKSVNGLTMRTYRLALSADHFYCQAVTGTSTPTITASLAKMTVSMNRINGVYNREFSIQMNFCSKEDTLIWPTNTGSVNGNDPFNLIDNNAPSCLTTNQTQCTNRVGSANYDLGHAFTTGAGGLSSLGVVCGNSQKAKSVTGGPSPVGDGFDIDYVAHEMGHEFGANHPFNNGSDGSCGGGNINEPTAYEPGSGSTIMAYAGICDPDDLQPHSDAYFHAVSVQEIVAKLNSSETACAVTAPTTNKLVSLPAFSASYTIPYKTPFELIGPAAVDSVADTSTTYCWEQWNLGDAGARLVQTFFSGPIFRSYTPVSKPTRVFPKVSMVLAGTLSNAGVENNEGEKVPDTARHLTFKMTVRDIIGGYGCITFPDDTIHLDAVSTGAANNYGGFKVTSQATVGTSYAGGNTQTITWNVVGTDAAPVSAANVIIYMSRDAGNTWMDTIGTFPNTGSANIIVPNPTANVAAARFKVKGEGNVFFNVNLKSFAVTHNDHPTAGVQTTHAPGSSDIKMFPVPASNVLHITTGADNFQVSVYNAIGQSVYTGTVNTRSDIAISAWVSGVYYLHFINSETGERTVKSIVVE